MSDLRDDKSGTYDVAPGASRRKAKVNRTPHRDAQSGADVRETVDYGTQTLPEGLVRERRGPMSPTRGRRQK